MKFGKGDVIYLEYFENSVYKILDFNENSYKICDFLDKTEGEEETLDKFFIDTKAVLLEEFNKPFRNFKIGEFLVEKEDGRKWIIAKYDGKFTNSYILQSLSKPRTNYLTCPKSLHKYFEKANN